MQARVAKFSINHDSKTLRPDLAISNMCRFLMLHDRNVVILPCGALFLSKENGPISVFKINLENEANDFFFTRFDSLIAFDDNGFFTAHKSRSIGGVEAVISGEGGDYRMFINSFGRLCIKKVQCDPEEVVFPPWYPIS